ncbi:MAG: DUF4251 domain-containing protein [Bacteroidales bacterium]|nr:DUF4251 domain-containing protein [Bacteroidales bacterium]
MKKIPDILSAVAAIAVSAVILSGCSASRMTPQQKEAEEQRVEEGVYKALDSGRYRIGVDTMIPRRGSAQHLTTPYSVTVDGDKLISYLPYFGVAYDVPYGGGKSLNFESTIKEYNRKTGKKGEELISIMTDNGEDVLYYLLTVFSNGKSSVDVRAKKRESISFWGELDPDDQPDFDKK